MLYCFCLSEEHCFHFIGAKHERIQINAQYSRSRLAVLWLVMYIYEQICQLLGRFEYSKRVVHVLAYNLQPFALSRLVGLSFSHSQSLDSSVFFIWGIFLLFSLRQYKYLADYSENVFNASAEPATERRPNFLRVVHSMHSTLYDLDVCWTHFIFICIKELGPCQQKNAFRSTKQNMQYTQNTRSVASKTPRHARWVVMYTTSCDHRLSSGF